MTEGHSINAHSRRISSVGPQDGGAGTSSTPSTNLYLIFADKLDDILGPHHSVEFTVPCFSWLYSAMFGFEVN